MSNQSLQHVHFFCSLLIVMGSSCLFCHTTFQHFDISKNQFQIDGLDITKRIDISIYMHHIGIFKASHNMDNGIHFPDIGKELITKTFSLGSSFHKACNVYKFNHRRGNFLCMIKLSQFLNSFIRNRYHTHIGINCRKRIVGSQSACFCKWIKKGTFSDVWKTHDS